MEVHHLEVVGCQREADSTVTLWEYERKMGDKMND